MPDAPELTDEERFLLGAEPLLDETPIQPPYRDWLVAPQSSPAPQPPRITYAQQAAEQEVKEDPYITPGNKPRDRIIAEIQQEMLDPDSVVRDDKAFTRIVDLSLVQLQDRLLYGDIDVDKYGQSHRVPMSATTLAQLVKLGVESRDAARRQLSGASSATDVLMLELIEAIRAKAPTIFEINHKVIDGELSESQEDLKR